MLRDQMNPTTLILFDIDGTLLTSGGAGENALKIGFEKEFGLAEDLSSVSIAGRTDSGIARQVLQKHGLEVSPGNIERFSVVTSRNWQSNFPSVLGVFCLGFMSCWVCCASVRTSALVC